MPDPAERLAAIPGIGRALAARLVRRGLTTRAALRGVLGELPRAARAHLRHGVAGRIPRATARAVLAELRRRLVVPGGRATFVVGSVRRGAPVAKDLDLLVVAAPPAGALAAAALAPPGPRDRLAFVETYAGGPRRRSLVVRWAPRGGRPRHYALDLFLATPPEEPYALLHHTGGRAYNVRIRAHAKRRGLTLNQYGLFSTSAAGRKRRARGTRALASEREVLRFLGATYRPPSRRQ